MSSKGKSSIAAAFAVLSLATTGVVGVATAAPATAAPECWTTPLTNNREVWGQCAQGTIIGQYRVVIRCEENNGSRYSRYGSWVYAPSISKAICAEGSWWVDKWIEYR